VTGGCSHGAFEEAPAAPGRSAASP
jgi:hypothetical protein